MKKRDSSRLWTSPLEERENTLFSRIAKGTLRAKIVVATICLLLAGCNRRVNRDYYLKEYNGNKTFTFVSRGHTYKAICERDGGDGSCKALLPYIGYHFLGWEREDKLALNDTAGNVRWVFTIQSIVAPEPQKTPNQEQ